MYNPYSTAVQPAGKNNRTHIHSFPGRELSQKSVPSERVPDKLAQITEKLRKAGFSLQTAGEKDELRRLIGITEEYLRRKGLNSSQAGKELLSNPDILENLKGGIINFRDTIEGTKLIHSVNEIFQKNKINLSSADSQNLSQYLRALRKELAGKGFDSERIIQVLKNPEQIKRLEDVILYIRKEQQILNDGIERAVKNARRKGTPLNPENIKRMRADAESIISTEISKRARSEALNIRKANITNIDDARSRRSARNYKEPSGKAQKDPSPDDKAPTSVVLPTASGNITKNASTAANVPSSISQPKASGNVLIDSSTNINAQSSPKVGLVGTSLLYAGRVLTVLPVGVTTYKSISEALRVENYDLSKPEGLRRYIDDNATVTRRAINRHLNIVRSGLSTGLASGAGSLAGTAAGIGIAAVSGPLAPVTSPVASITTGLAVGIATYGPIDNKLKEMQDVLLEVFYATSDNKKRIELMQKFKQLFAARDMYQSLGKAKNIREYLRNNIKLFDETAKKMGKRVIKPGDPPCGEIRILQFKLNEMGYFKGTVSGTLDKNTIEAFSKFFGRKIAQVDQTIFKEIKNVILSKAGKLEKRAGAISIIYHIPIPKISQSS